MLESKIMVVQNLDIKMLKIIITIKYRVMEKLYIWNGMVVMFMSVKYR